MRAAQIVADGPGEVDMHTCSMTGNEVVMVFSRRHEMLL